MITAEANASSGSHAEEDENYFVSMTDMMVGILFIFIIMLMVFALNFQQQTDQTRTLTAQQEEQLRRANELADQIAALRRQIADQITELDKANQARGDLLETIQKRLEGVGLKVTIDKDTGVLRLTEDAIRFDRNVSLLNETAARNVDALARVLLDVLPRYTACGDAAGCPPGSGFVVETLFIEGHTDTVGGPDRNWQLSTERAVNTYRRIVGGFPRLRTLMNSQGQEVLSVSAYAHTRPATKGEDEDAHRINRRIDLRFLMEADRRERLTSVLRLLDEMETKVNALQTPALPGPPPSPEPSPALGATP
ncbi:flagellar motor protein MotB [Angulomicrobium tetraedrale]|uniref:Flagellar motor protein MotB n=1 Tax=Ancylobacter tetraedralis TaxID=217068 RepID=A0A839ZBC5_9HYPH|nr:OmpA family protein [Ancylobacter tetraedralis]MBB3771998.1 flagellar motor protein MotB [Ancylobacter tetraedralis]